MPAKQMGGSHACAALGCTKVIPLAWLMCRSHWFMMPLPIRRQIWATVNKMGAEYTVAVNAAIDAVAEKEAMRR